MQTSVIDFLLRYLNKWYVTKYHITCSCISSIAMHHYDVSVLCFGAPISYVITLALSLLSVRLGFTTSIHKSSPPRPVFNERACVRAGSRRRERSAHGRTKRDFSVDCAGRQCSSYRAAYKRSQYKCLAEKFSVTHSSITKCRANIANLDNIIKIER